jgi:hypothetical protein
MQLWLSSFDLSCLSLYQMSAFRVQVHGSGSQIWGASCGFVEGIDLVFYLVDW